MVLQTFLQVMQNKSVECYRIECTVSMMALKPMYVILLTDQAIVIDIIMISDVYHKSFSYHILRFLIFKI